MLCDLPPVDVPAISVDVNLNDDSSSDVQVKADEKSAVTLDIL